MLNEETKNEVENLCSKFLQQKSYSGEENGMVDKIKNIFSGFGFTDYYVDKYGSIIGHIKGAKPGKKIMFDGHIDTVPVNESEWTCQPFAGEKKDGKIYGRGASDMKGAVSAMICAAKQYAADHPDFCGDIYISCVVQEECFEGVASREISKTVSPDYVIIGEATGLNLNIGQRGRAEIVVETFGKPAHSANPKIGVNAVTSMMKLLAEIDKIKPAHNDILGEGIMVLTDIISSPYPGKSVVPSYCKATFDRRILVGETKDGILAIIKSLIDNLEASDPDFKASVKYAYGKETCYTGEVIEDERFFPAWLASSEADYVKKAFDGLKKAGINTKLSHYSFCTNGSHYAGEAGIKTLGFGPSYENIAHTTDEYIETEQLYGAVEGYYAILNSLL